MARKNTLKFDRDDSDFFLQLKLLLWKNYTLKKRRPFVFLFEIVIPLALFFILLLIRKTQVGIPIHVSNYRPMALPSAGMIPVLQTFCPDDSQPGNNTRLAHFLQKLGLFLDDELPRYADQLSSTLDSASGVDILNQLWDKTKDIPVREIVKDVPGLTHLLETKYNISKSDTDLLLNSTLNITTIKHIADSQLDPGTIPLAITGILSGSSLDGLLAAAGIGAVRDIMCVSGLEILQLEPVERKKLQATVQKHVCSMDDTVLTGFVHDIGDRVELNPGLIERLMQTRTAPSMADTEKALEDSYYPVISLLMEIQKLFPNLPDMENNGHSQQGNSTTDKYSGLVRGWTLVEPVVCGPLDPPVNGSTDTEQTRSKGLTTAQEKSFKILTNVMYHNPKVLYAPNNTAANKIIQKMSQTFNIFKDLSSYARKWLIISSQIRTLHLVSPSIPMNDSILNTMRVIDMVAETWLDVTSGVSFDVFRGFRSELELEYYFLNKQYHDNVTVMAGLVFTNLYGNTSSLPVHVHYKIRQNATLNPPTNQARAPFWFPSAGSDILYYYSFGFVWIQDLVERAIINLQTGRDIVSPGVYLHRMPYPCWNWDGFVWLIQHILPLCLMLSWVYPISTLVQRIVYEKEKRLKEVMKMMGLSNGVHWCAWLTTAWLQMTFTVILLTCMLHFGHVLPYSNPWIIFLFLEVFAVSLIAFAFLISSLYSKAKLAAACAGIFYFLTYVPYAYIAVREDVTSIVIPAQAKTVASLFSTTALGLAGKYFLFYELQGTGVQWSNMMVSPKENDDFNLLIVILMMCADTFLYSLLTWYIENVHPGTYGIPKPWYFPFTKSYWCGGHHEPGCSSWQWLWSKFKDRWHPYDRLATEEEQCDLDPDEPDSSYNFEPSEPDLPVGVSVNNLRKVYEGSKKAALNNLCMTLYEDQITSFLGHNGAGKTTTMSILTGLYPPTSGTATVYGQDIRTDMDTIRQSMGICPQHNVLFDLLTVEEHLWFFARLKGMKLQDIERETKLMLRDLGLLGKRSAIPGCLSGGMQRKLSVAMAFVGGSRTVILDEPTAGVDPYSRRSIWNLLLKYKSGRTILVSTHHMDEAERLGDRVAIISNGRLKCCGSPLYLKSVLGQGQHLHILWDQYTETFETDHDNTSAVLATIRAHVPSTFINSKTEKELHIIIPVESDKKGPLVAVLEDLTANKSRLGIKSFGVSDNGLEEVFLKVTKDSIKDGQSVPTQTRPGAAVDTTNQFTLQDLSENQHTIRDESNSTSYLGSHRQTVTGCYKFFSHFRALLVLRFRFVFRNPKGLFSQIILPSIFITIAMTIALSAPQDSDPLPVTLSPAMFFNITRPKGNYVPYSIHKSAFKTRNIVAEGGAGPFALRDTFKLPSGIGATCVLKSPFRDEFDRDLVHRGDSSTRRKVIRLVAEYFEPECRSVFTPGINLRVYMPPADVEKSKANKDDSVNNTLTNAKYYPYCNCKKDNVGFKCGADGFVDPPQEIVVTGDILQDITGTSDHDFYLNTNDRFRLHRYGGFMFGKQLSYVPTSFGKEKQFRFFAKNLIVKDTSQVWFNEKGYHSMPIYVNTLSNAILRANLPPSKGNPAAYGITLVNHPMKKTNNFLDEDYIKGGMDVLMAIFIIVAMAFVPASFVVFPVYERSIKAKHLQFVSGLNKGVYWVTNYLWDLCNYMIPAICIIVILLAFHLPAYVANGNFEAVLALFLLYGWSVTPMMYPATFLFSEPSVAFIVMILANLFTGITCVVSSFMLELFSHDESISRINAILKKVFLVFPNYCLGNGLMDIAMNEYKNEFYSHIGQYDMIHSPMEWDLTGKKLVAMAITGALSFVITLLCEYGFFIRRQRTEADGHSDILDSDVLAEQERTLRGSGRNNLLRLQNLTKVYKRWRKTDIVAVNRLTFAVPTGECFGLLGINGAGKTTTFKMLTGDIQPTSGDASIGGHSISRDLGSVQRQIGYCPQFDALFDQLTPREHLQLYARLRGIPAVDEPSVVEHAISSLDLVKYADQPAGTLSGGNKRKLSTAISLIGDPPLIYMDEPTSGMDPYSRRFLWGVIQNLVKEGKSVLFTSHSMAECETLCSRLSIMVNGQLKCLGSIQHLKDKYGNGYTLTISLKSNAQVQDVADYVVSRVPKCVVKDIGYRIVVLDIKVRYSGLADIYKEMETVKLVFDVADYTLSQNTLDNVFINFAKEQSDVVQYLEEESKVSVEYDLDLSAGRRTRMNCESEAGQHRELADDDEPLIEMNPRDTRLEIHSDDDLLMPY